MKCEYGCENEGKFRLKNGKMCCMPSPNSCSNIKQKNSKGLHAAYTSGRKNRNNFGDSVYWATGLKASQDPRIRSKYMRDDIFVKGKLVANQVLKNAFLTKVEYKCSKCNIKDWNNEKIILELDHIDSDKCNNTVDNLRLLCPNCHSQTLHFRGRGKKVNVRVSDDTLTEALNSSDTVKAALIKCGLSLSCGNYLRVNNLRV